MFVDTHCHYYDEAFASDADAAIARAREAGVGIMIEADIDRNERPLMLEQVRRYPGVLYPMLGLYPGSVRSDWREELDEIERLLPTVRPVAIGEIGLDYHEGKAFAPEQREALMAQFELAAQHDLPVNIHLRDATEDFLHIVRDAARLHLRGNLHCFSLSTESFRQLRRYADFSVGIGGVVTFKNSHLRESLREIPLDCILLETDCPYLAPVPQRGRRNESMYLPLIAAEIARAKDLSLAEVEAATTRNALRLFSIPLTHE